MGLHFKWEIQIAGQSNDEFDSIRIAKNRNELKGLTRFTGKMIAWKFNKIWIFWFSLDYARVVSSY